MIIYGTTTAPLQSSLDTIIVLVIVADDGWGWGTKGGCTQLIIFQIIGNFSSPDSSLCR
jgi:hypothetical protein